ncbi:MAG: hypothetical protein U0359_18235 [Byssovorax sp.]
MRLSFRHTPIAALVLTFASTLGCTTSVSFGPGDTTTGAGADPSGGGGTGGTGGVDRPAATGAGAGGGAATVTGAAGSATTGAGGGPVDCAGVDFATDPHHCGACGHDCLGASCDAGMCAPIALVTEGGQPFEIALDADHVYWYNSNGTIKKISKHGGSVKTLSASNFNPAAITVFGGLVYFAQYDSWDAVKTIPVSGGATQVIAKLDLGGTGLAVDDASIYWTSFTMWPQKGSIMRSPRLGGAPVMLVDDAHGIQAMGVDGTHLYWSVFTDEADNPPAPGPGGLRRVPIGGGAPEVVTTSNDCSTFALDGDDVYWSYTGPGLMSGETGKIMRVAKSGGASVEVAPAPGAAGSLAVDAGYVYFTSSVAHNVRKVPKQGGEVTVLATSNGNPYAIAVDDEAVYWVDPGNGTVNKVAK